VSEIDPGFLRLPLDPLADAALGAMSRTPGVGYGDIRVQRDLIQDGHGREHALFRRPGV
jgi:hypothetical protein